MGRLRAVRFHKKARPTIRELPGLIRRGDAKPLPAWLGKRIHRPGMRYRAHDLAPEITGKPFSVEPLSCDGGQEQAEVCG